VCSWIAQPPTLSAESRNWLGNELSRSDTSIHSTLPGLKADLATRLLEALRGDIAQLVRKELRLRVTVGPLWSEGDESSVDDDAEA